MEPEMSILAQKHTLATIRCKQAKLRMLEISDVKCRLLEAAHLSQMGLDLSVLARNLSFGYFKLLRFAYNT